MDSSKVEFVIAELVKSDETIRWIDPKSSAMALANNVCWRVVGSFKSVVDVGTQVWELEHIRFT